MAGCKKRLTTGADQMPSIETNAALVSIERGFHSFPYGSVACERLYETSFDWMSSPHPERQLCCHGWPRRSARQLERSGCMTIS